MITGRTVRSCYYLLARIREQLHKQSHQAITIKEFCAYMGLPENDVSGLIAE